MMTTSLRLLRQHNACDDRYAHLVAALGPGWGDRKRIPVTRILETNGLDDAIWALRAVPQAQSGERDRLARVFSCRCVRETPLADGRTVWDLLTDERSRNAVVVAERFANGDATEKKLAAARYAAGAAAAARYAAGAAAWTAARYAAGDTPGAAGAAALAAAWAAAWTAAWTSMDTAGDTAGAAWAAAGTARDAAGDTAGEKQTRIFMEVFA